MHWNQIFYFSVLLWNRPCAAPFAWQTTSNGSFATHCIISIVSNFVSANLVTTRMSHFLLYARSITLQITSESDAVTNSMHPQSYHAHTFNIPPLFETPLFLPSSPNHSPSITGGGVDNLATPGIRQGNLDLTAFFIPFITQETQRCHTVLTPRSHFFEQNQKQKESTAVKSELTTTSCSWTILLPKQTKEIFMPLLILNRNFIKKDVILGFPWESNLKSPVHKRAALTSTLCWPGNWAISIIKKLLVYC